MDKQKKWTLTGCLLWIVGLTVFIVGMNLTGSVKDWMMVAGSIVFMAGLGITGAMWVIRKKQEEEQEGMRGGHTAAFFVDQVPEAVEGMGDYVEREAKGLSVASQPGIPFRSGNCGLIYEPCCAHG